MLWNAHQTGFHLAPGQRIGLLGGSFDPPHEGHVRITLEALKRFRLDRVLWLVSPGNPLKPKGPAPLEARIAAARDLMQHPRVRISGFEALAGTRHTARTLELLQKGHPGVRFVWLMGADNLAQLHRWEDWREIMRRVPVGVLARPGSRLAAQGSVAASVFRHARLPGSAAPLLPLSAPPSWCFVNLPMSDLSSTALRARAPRRASAEPAEM
ncbi:MULTISPECIES: nicotinate-nucleotide adenylyltransferase [unclassified Salipiger]|uniref:nicotinate-nucleotide adenylyltransferase n=1 Tax=unclassified Salipiger TaxID=2640570 RepID=UPI0013BC37C4|nr:MULTISPECIES: nicotinate-nucleotide adenylyltransferase [unclassified Salipiger]NDV48067.1 nicotinate-nucleotide adenylyltransferase [Salipiger sp. PrR003]NDW33259.1 nicotinate-nucleotide adenylyltransferase [Salipiger sp. PrR007]